MRFKATLLQLTALCGMLVVFNSIGVAQNRVSPIAAGEEAPDFTLESHDGTKVTLSKSREKSPVVLVFYRGYW